MAIRRPTRETAAICRWLFKRCDDRARAVLAAFPHTHTAEHELITALRPAISDAAWDDIRSTDGRFAYELVELALDRVDWGEVARFVVQMEKTAS